mmetsp:Transcript_10129/g.61636  ORF Transcript_10129/g.61636 Transcript_10129/m.61636 type:complete len:119 (-) Transcript_10129:1740-2096(-)
MEAWARLANFGGELANGNKCAQQTENGKLCRNKCTVWQSASARQAVASRVSKGNIHRGRRRMSADPHSKTKIMHVSRGKSRCTPALRTGAAAGGSRPLRISRVFTVCITVSSTSFGQA